MNKKVITGLILCLISVASIAQQFDPAFKNLVNSAYAKSDSVRINGLRIEQSKIDEQTARFNYLPRVSGNATYTRLNDDIVFPTNLQTLLTGTQSLLVKEKVGIPFNSQLPSSVALQPVPPVQEKNILKVTGNTQWVLFSGFKVENAIKASKHQQSALQFSNQTQLTKLIHSLSDLYDKLALLYASDSIINSSEVYLQEQSRFVEGAIRNGLATPLERKKINLARQKLELRKVENEGNRIILLERLHQLTGIETAELNAMRPVLQPMLLSNIQGFQERAEIKALNEAIKATRYKEKMELSEYIPKLAAFGQYEFRDHDLSMFDPKWYAGLRLQWNLFDGFTARNNAKKTTLDRQAYEIQKQNAEELIALAKAKTRQEQITANQRIKMVQAQVSLADETLEFVTKQYKNGLTNMTELLNALNDLEKAKFDLQQAYYEQRKASLQLLDANGVLLNNF